VPTNEEKYDGGDTMVWVSAIGNTNTDGGVKDSYTKLEPGDNDALNTVYYLRNTFNIRLDPTAGAANSSAPLTVSTIAVTGASATSFSDCLSVLVVCTYDGTTKGDLWQYNDVGTTFASTLTNAKLTAGNMAKGVVATIDIYVFFNGDDADCTLSKLAAAADGEYSVEVTFTCV
jgi:hypothetical protein